MSSATASTPPAMPSSTSRTAESFVHAVAGLFCGPGDQAADLTGGITASGRQFPHFGGHHAKGAAGLASPCGLDGGRSARGCWSGKLCSRSTSPRRPFRGCALQCPRSRPPRAPHTMAPATCLRPQRLTTAVHLGHLRRGESNLADDGTHAVTGGVQLLALLDRCEWPGSVRKPTWSCRPMRPRCGRHPAWRTPRSVVGPRCLAVPGPDWPGLASAGAASTPIRPRNR